MPHFPLFVDLTGQPILVVGGGAVALRKLQKLAPYGGRPTVVAPEILPEIAALPGVTLRRRAFRVWDLRPRPALVIAATDDPAVNHRVSVLCRKRHIAVNTADDPENCSFLFPALVQQGRFSAGISTGGASPTAAAYFKTQLQSLLSEHLDEMLDWLEAQRPAVKAAIHDPSKRSAALRRMCYACLEKGAPLTEEEVSRYLAGENLPAGSVALVGAGCGKADLITLRGLRLLQQCQAVVYDDLIDPVLLDAVPESARKIYMGKRSGAHSAPPGGDQPDADRAGPGGPAGGAAQGGRPLSLRPGRRGDAGPSRGWNPLSGGAGDSLGHRHSGGVRDPRDPPGREPGAAHCHRPHCRYPGRPACGL